MTIYILEQKYRDVWIFIQISKQNRIWLTTDWFIFQMQNSIYILYTHFLIGLRKWNFTKRNIHIPKIHKVNEVCFNLNEFISKIYVVFVKITETISRTVGWYVDINYPVRLKPKEWYNARFSGLIKIIWCRITKINWSAKNAAGTALASIENNLSSN